MHEGWDALSNVTTFTDSNQGRQFQSCRIGDYSGKTKYDFFLNNIVPSLLLPPSYLDLRSPEPLARMSPRPETTTKNHSLEFATCWHDFRPAGTPRQVGFMETKWKLSKKKSPAPEQWLGRERGKGENYARNVIRKLQRRFAPPLLL